MCPVGYRGESVRKGETMTGQHGNPVSARPERKFKSKNDSHSAFQDCETGCRKEQGLKADKGSLDEVER